MIIEWIHTQGLMESRPDRNILKGFPLSVRTTIVKSIVEYLTKHYNEAIKLLKTHAHIYWMIEVIGQAFQLPMKEHETIEKALKIYHKWVFQVLERPQPIQEDPQTFIMDIFRHITFLFQKIDDSNYSEEDQKNQIFLCNRAMVFFLDICTHGDLIDGETWDHIMLICVGITDKTIRSKNGLPQLSHGLLKVLFELWICSLTHQFDIWETLQKFVILWKNEPSVVHQWSALCKALALRVINILYGPLEGTNVIRIQWQGLNSIDNTESDVRNSVTELDLPDEYVFFLFNMFLHILGNPNDISNRDVFLMAFQGLEKISTLFAKCGTGINIQAWREGQFRLPFAPDTNSLVNYFGSWYFECVNSEKLKEFSEGRAIAYRALCQIFCRKGGKTPSEENLSLFYHSIIQGLNDSDLCIHSIMLNSDNIFTVDLPGSLILVPHYTDTCKKLLCGEYASMDNPSELRSRTVKLLTSLICLPQHFGGELFSELNISINNMLIDAMQVEKNASNLRHVLWTVTVFIFENIDKHPGFAKTAAMTLFKIIKLQSTKLNTPQYPATVFKTIFQVFSVMTLIYHKISVTYPEYASDVVSVLSQQLPPQLDYLSRNPIVFHELILEIFVTIGDLLLVGSNEILKEEAQMKALLSAIQTATQLCDDNKHPDKYIQKVQSAAKFTIGHMLNTFGNFPNNRDYTTNLSLTNEEIEAPDCKDMDSRYVKYFILMDQFLYSIVEKPGKDDHSTTITLIFRDITGKHTWDSQMKYMKETDRASLTEIGYYAGSSHSQLRNQSSAHENNETLLRFHVHNPLECGAEKDDHYVQMIKDHDLPDQESKDIPMDLAVRPPLPPNRYEGTNMFQLGRLLMSHLGLLQIDHLKYLSQLKVSTMLRDYLRKLDQQPSRDTHSISVLYVGVDKITRTDILQETSGSERFNAFVSNLGWNVDLKSHKGFIGQLDPEGILNGPTAPYFATYKEEMIFLISTNGKSNQESMDQKKKIITNDPVNIIWCEGNRNYFPPTFKSQKTGVYIMIYPLKNGLLRINIALNTMSVFRPEDFKEVLTMGPLCDGMIVSEKILAPLLRRTCLNAIQLIRARYPAVTPYQTRSEILQQIVKSQKLRLENYDYYNDLFHQKERIMANDM